VTQRRLFLLIFGCLIAVVTAQNLGTPRNAGPDEPAHIVRGAGLVRGEVFGESYGDWLRDGPVLDPGGADIARADLDSSALAVYDVPRWVARPSATCFAHQGDVPATCSADDLCYDVDGGGSRPCTPDERSGDGALSTAASYPIWSHILPGLATLLVHSSTALWLARFLHAIVPVVLVAATLTHLLATSRQAAASAVLLATTPMLLFLLAVVNPSGVAIAGAITAWVTLDDVLRTGRAPWWLLTLGFGALVLPRNDGLIWAALIVGVLALVWRRNPLTLWSALPPRNRIAIAAVSVVGAAWALISGGGLVPVAKPDNFVDRVLMNTGQHLREAVGVLGWLDTPLPESMYALWFFTAGLVVMIALVTREYVRAIGAAAALALFVVVGWVLEIVQGRTAGLFWQGRYALPVLVGMVIVAAMGSDIDRRIGPVAAAVPGALALVVWNVAFFQQLRRWAVGTNGSIRPWAWDTWDTPVPIPLVIVVHVAATALLAWVCWSPRRAAV
jgi:hypothetical protein